MSKKIKDDGGPAFPRSAMGPSGDHDWALGMSLRDWFAGMALQGLISWQGTNGISSNEYHPSQISYKLADAMLKQRGE